MRALVLPFAMLAAVAAPAPAAKYTLTDLGVTTRMHTGFPAGPSYAMIGLTPEGGIVYGQDRGQAGGYSVLDGLIGKPVPFAFTLTGPDGQASRLDGTGLGLSEWGFAVNRSGTVVGAEFDSIDSFTGRPIAFTASGGKVYLPHLGNRDAALAINDSGLIVGQAGPTLLGSVALLIDGPVAADLNTLIPTASGLRLASATGVDDSGRIVGLAVDGQGQFHDFLLTPAAVPEPSALWPVGLAALATWRRTRARAVGSDPRRRLDGRETHGV